MSKRRISMSLTEEHVEALDEFCDEFSLSRSAVLDDIIGRYLTDEEEPGIEEAVDDATLELAKREEADKRMRKIQKMREKRHSWGDRIKGFLRQRIEGDEAYEPDGVRDLAQGYREDAEIWAEDDAEIESKHDKLDKWLDYYELGYWARQHADEVETEVNSEDVSGWFAVGEDLYRLRTHFEEVVDHVRSVADREGVGWDADAVVDSVCRKWTVCRGAVLLLLEHMVANDEETISDMLRLGGDSVRELDLPRLVNGREPLTELPDGGEIDDQFVGDLDQPGLQTPPGRGFNPDRDDDRDDRDGQPVDRESVDWIESVEEEAERASKRTDGGAR